MTSIVCSVDSIGESEDCICNHVFFIKEKMSMWWNIDFNFVLFSTIKIRNLHYYKLLQIFLWNVDKLIRLCN